MRSDREEICDTMAIESLGYQENIHYGETIIKLLTQFEGGQSHFLPETVGILEDKGQIVTRITTIRQLSRRLPYSSLLATILLACLAAVTLTSTRAIEPSTKAPLSDLQKATLAKLEKIQYKNLEFAGATLSEAVNFLQNKSAANDPEGKGVQITLQLTPEQMKFAAVEPDINITTGGGGGISLKTVLDMLEGVRKDYHYEIDSSGDIVFKPGGQPEKVSIFDSLIFKDVSLQDVTLKDVAAYIQSESVKLDPEKKGVKVVLDLAPGQEDNHRITIHGTMTLQGLLAALNRSYGTSGGPQGAIVTIEPLTPSDLGQ
jgi:hypothetical protein